MNSKSKWLRSLLPALVLFTSIPLASQPAAAAEAQIKTGSFDVLSYNVGGLPDIFSSSNPEEYTVQISPKLNAYDIINVQEDFNYHAELISEVTHPYLTPSSGVAGFGSGLNSLSRYPYRDLQRITWNDRYGLFDSGSDELTPKGFTFMTYEIEPGVKVDVYNLHADAGSDEQSLAARRSNIEQLSSYIEQHSEGNAVIVFGDTNTRYTRADDNIEMLMTRNGLNDPWVDLVRGGQIPADGEALMDESDVNGPNFEIVDKILYRGSSALQLNAESFRIEDSYFLTNTGEQLSDHYPITAEFAYSTFPDVQISSSIGGPGGSGFNDLDQIPDSRMSAVTIDSGSRVDGLSTVYEDGTVLAHGGTATQNTLQLAENEYLTQAVIGQGTYNDGKRIFNVQLTTNLGNTVSGGQATSEQMVLNAPEGWYIAGFYGRAGDELDQLGVIYKPLSSR